jgi:hypothetical protein
MRLAGVPERLVRRRQNCYDGLLLMAKVKPSDRLKKLRKITRSPKHQTKLQALAKTKREAWNKGLVKMDMELPHELYQKIEALAKKAGMSTSQAISLILSEYAKDRWEEEERITHLIDKVFDEAYDRLAGPLELETQKLEEFNRTIFELFPSVKSKLAKKASN